MFLLTILVRPREAALARVVCHDLSLVSRTDDFFFLAAWAGEAHAAGHVARAVAED